MRKDIKIIDFIKCEYSFWQDEVEGNGNPNDLGSGNNEKNKKIYK